MSRHPRRLRSLGLGGSAGCSTDEVPVLFWRNRSTLAIPIPTSDVRLYNALAQERGWNRLPEPTVAQTSDRARRNAMAVTRVEDEFSYFSSTHNLPFTAHSRSFASIEHYVTWRKALLFNDSVLADVVLRIQHPVMAQRLRRLILGFPRVPKRRWGGARAAAVMEERRANDQRWATLRQAVYDEAVRAKCASQRAWCDQLVETGSACIGECNPFDPTYGVLRTDARDERPTQHDWPARALDPSAWDGDNVVGRSLMRVRADTIQ